LQSCKYHLLHYLASGRSVDSGKRRGVQLQVPDCEDGQGFWDQIDSGNCVLNWVSARDIIALLSPQLSAQEKAVLDCFADGLGPREIGRKLSVTHTMVIKHRRKIAALFTRLENAGPPLKAINGFNGSHKDQKVNGLNHVNGNGRAKAVNGTGFELLGKRATFPPQVNG